MKKYFPYISIILFCLFGAINTLSAQEIVVSGIITDKNDTPLPGVTIVEKGTTNGVTSDLVGYYIIELSSPDAEIEFSFVGFKPQSLKYTGNQEINVILESEIYEVDEVVVTALNIPKESKSLGYAVTAVGSEELTDAGDKNILNALQGKIAGVNITSASGAPGSSTRIMVRGISSLTGGNQPLFVIDGVPVNNSHTGSSSINGGSDYGNKINDVNMDDVESISFLKGASGTALYGSRAANGVIIITTKKGEDGGQAKVSYSSSFGFENPLRLVKYQNEFGQGIYGNSVLYENMSWGPRFDSKLRPWGNTVDGVVRVKAYRALPDNVKEFFDTGKSQSHSLSVSGGRSSTTYYFSVSTISWDGIFPTDADKYNKHTLSLRGTQQIRKNIEIATSVNYIRKETNSVLTGQGETSVYNQVMQTPRDISLLDLKDLSNPFNTIDNYYSLYTVNPYYILENNENKNTENRIYGSFDFDMDLPYALHLKWRVGADISNEKIESYTAPVIPEGNNANASVYNAGSRGLSEISRKQLNSDIILSWTKKIRDFEVSALAGQAANERQASSFGTSVSSQQLDDYINLSNSLESPVSSESSSLIRSLGVYASADLSYKSLVFVSITGRNEWSSTLPADNNSFFFPGINTGFIFTELLPGIKPILPFGKLRLSWAMVGNDAPAYATSQTIQQATHSDGYGYFGYPTSTGVNSYEMGSYIGNPDLKPEMSTEKEVGLDLRFFNNRIGLDVAYYDKKVEDLIWASPVATSSGYQYKIQNLGTMQNKGIEALVRVVPIKKSNFNWEISVNYTKNYNKLLSLNNQLEKAELNALRVDGGQQIQWMAIPGQPIGVFEGRGPEYTDDGKMIVDNQGLPTADSDLKTYGNSQYDFTAGITNTVDLFGVQVSCNFDVRMGGLMYSRTKDIALWSGTSPETLYNDREPFIIPNSVYEVDRDENGDAVYAKNTIPINSVTMVDYWGNGGSELDGASLVDKSFIKLREITIGYSLTKDIIEKLPVRRIFLGVSGKNLWLWTPSNQYYIDPELTTFGNDLAADFGEYGAQPSVRTFLFNVKVDF